MNNFAAQIILCGHRPGGTNAADPGAAETAFDAAVRAGLQAAIPVPAGLRARLLALKTSSPPVRISQREIRPKFATRPSRRGRLNQF